MSIPYSTDAWQIFGVGIGQAEIIGFGMVIATALIVGYRTMTRRKRYGRG